MTQLASERRAPAYRALPFTERRTLVERVAFRSALACTETTGMGTSCWLSEEAGNIGIPGPGAEVKLLPLDGADGRYEMRLHGPHMSGGYLRHPELTAAVTRARRAHLVDQLYQAEPAAHIACAE
jgi:hypothetical protein